MNMIEIPHLVEIFFVLSTIVFTVTLYVILPVLIFQKRAFDKPSFINAPWRKYSKSIFSSIQETAFPPKKKILEIYCLPSIMVEKLN